MCATVNGIYRRVSKCAYTRRKTFLRSQDFFYRGSRKFLVLKWATAWRSRDKQGAIQDPLKCSVDYHRFPKAQVGPPQHVRETAMSPDRR